MRSSTSGQASAEYVAVLTLVAVVIALAATAVAEPGIAAAVVRALRTGICIAGGDVCRSVDAKAKGLEPCVVYGEERDKEDGISFVLRRSKGASLVVRKLSDGSWTIEAVERDGLDFGKGLVNVHLGPVSVETKAGVEALYRSGSRWDLSDAQARALLARVKADPTALADREVRDHLRLPEPSVVFDEGGAAADLAASAGLDAGDLHLDAGLVDARAEAVIGRRTGAGGSTWYLKPSAELSSALGDLGGKSTVAEYHEGPPARLVLREPTEAAGDREVERLTTLPLRDGEDRASVMRVLFGDFASPAVARLEAQRMRARLANDGIHERRVYETRTVDHELGLEVVDLGFDRSESTTRRRLVDAEVTTGGRTAHRIDCLGLDRT